jgi:hypothetical protein
MFGLSKEQQIRQCSFSLWEKGRMRVLSGDAPSPHSSTRGRGSRKGIGVDEDAKRKLASQPKADHNSSL